METAACTRQNWNKCLAARKVWPAVRVYNRAKKACSGPNLAGMILRRPADGKTRRHRNSSMLVVGPRRTCPEGRNSTAGTSFGAGTKGRRGTRRWMSGRRSSEPAGTGLSEHRRNCQKAGTCLCEVRQGRMTALAGPAFYTQKTCLSK